MAVTLPADLTLRAPISADIQEVAELVRACELTDTGSSDVDAEVIQDTWQNMDLTTNAFVLVNAEGQIVGYTSIKLYGQLLLLDPNSGVRLDYRERGLERYLLQLAEARGRALWAESGKEGIPEVKTWSMTPARRRQLEAQEYTVRSSDMSMVIDLREHPPVFREIAGLEIRRAELPREIRAVHFVIQEAFQDVVSLRPCCKRFSRNMPGATSCGLISMWTSITRPARISSTLGLVCVAQYRLMRCTRRWHKCSVSL